MTLDLLPSAQDLFSGIQVLAPTLGAEDFKPAGSFRGPCLGARLQAGPPPLPPQSSSAFVWASEDTFNGRKGSAAQITLENQCPEG